MTDADDELTPDEKDAAQRITTALARFKLGDEARKQQRDREKAALAFQVPSKQWPEDVQRQRAGQTIGGVAIPARPMLSVPSLDQPIQLILNAEKAAHLGVQIHPLSEDADDDTAEVLAGLYRRIEVDSRANLARSFGFERGVKAGTGEYEVTTEYDDEGGSKFDQRIVIKRILHQGSVVRDPFAQEPDWSDGLWAFKTTDLQWATYKQRYGKSKLANFTESELVGLGNEQADWMTGDGEGRTVRIAAYYEIRLTTRTVVLLEDGTDAFDDEIPQGKKVMSGAQAKSRDCEHRVLWTSIINAIEELEPAQEQDGKYIPLIPCIGRELIPFDGERRWMGVVEPNMDAVRLLNYSASGAVERVALESKVPYIGPAGFAAGRERQWERANVVNFPYLEYEPVSLNGQPVGPPERNQVDVGQLTPSMMLLQQAREFIHSGTGAFEAALGQAAPQNKTKGGLLALQAQHEQGNSHFLDNLAEITLTYEAKVVLDLIPHIYDRPGRVARILDKEDKPRTVLLNAPYVMDPQSQRPRALPPTTGGNGNGNGAGMPTPQPPMVGPNGPMAGPPPMQSAPALNQGQPVAPMGAGSPQAVAAPKVLHYNLKKGRYGVTVSIGKAYKSRVDEGSNVLGQIIASDPQLLQLAGDIYFKFQDFPGHLELSERFKKMLPPPLQDQQDAQAAHAQVGQLQQQLQMLQGELQKAADIIKTETVKHQATIDVEKIHADLQIKLQVMKNAASIDVARINATTKGILSAHEAQDEEIALNQQLAHEATQNEHDRAHEAGLAAMQHDQAMQQAQQGVAGDAALADQGQAHALAQSDQSHQQALEQGAAGHDQTMEQAQQAADLAPPPTDGANA